MKAKGRLSVGVLGAGGVVADLHLPVLLNCTGASVVWVADKDDARAKSVANAFRIPWLALPDGRARLITFQRRPPTRYSSLRRQGGFACRGGQRNARAYTPLSHRHSGA